MIELLTTLPVSFWVVIALLVGGGYWALQRLDSGIGLPSLAVLGTTAAWYVGDAFYNDYVNNHAKIFDASTLASAWWQVAWFLTVFLAATPEINRLINSRCPQHRSGVMQLLRHGVGFPVIQTQLNKMFTGCAIAWTALSVIALLLLKGEIIYYLFPFLGYKANPWVHGRIGSGFDALSVLATYIQLLTGSMFGVVAALAKDKRVRWLALLFCLLAWPNFIFDRTRNTMLAMIIPAILSWVFLRVRGGIWKKAAILLACFCVVNLWMKFVIANRSEMTITSALKQKGVLSDQKKARNEGLNMYEELCWITTFIDRGTYHVNWGQRYFAELVNPIPRGLWPGKPLIGIDYAIARGQGGGESGAAGVFATISTGMIGQGVVNFGRLFGPMVAALLMSLWVAFLTRLDLNIHALGRLPMYSLGLILTFNLGRDITLITLYPFVFGMLGFWWWERQHPQPAAAVARPTAPRPASQPSAPTRSLFARRQTTGGFAKRSAPAKPSTGQNHTH